MIREILRDARALSAAASVGRGGRRGEEQQRPAGRNRWAMPRRLLGGAGRKSGSADGGVKGWPSLLANDSFAVLVLWRAREASLRLGVPLVNTLLRRAQTVLFGVEIDRRARLGEGVWMVHPIGTVIGGDSRIGNRVRLMGSNTIGTNRDDGYPDVGDDVTVGVGARILGPVRIGDGARIGAGAVVLDDVPAGTLAVGVPARILVSGDGSSAVSGPPLHVSSGGGCRGCSVTGCRGEATGRRRNGEGSLGHGEQESS